jgi:signal transduction histidine kinase/CheY-like chemotaxis protein/HPt (histidine-containing phosphotransfer) domain-containing protein
MELSAGSAIVDFAQLIALAAVILVAFSQSGRRRTTKRPRRDAAFIGIGFGAIMALTTLNPILVAPGVAIDGRAALLVLAGLFGGPISTAAAAVVGFDYRALLEGNDCLGGFASMLLSAAVGIAGHRLLRRTEPRAAQFPLLFALALAGALSAEVGVLLIGPPVRDIALHSVAIPLGMRTFCGILLIGFLILREQRRSALEAELTESQERFRTMSANAPGVLYQRVMQPDGGIHYTYLSEQCRAVFGLAPEEVIADSARMLAAIHAGDRKRFQESIVASARDLTIWDEQLRILRPGRPITWVRSIARPHRRADGATVWDGFVVDVTDKVESDLALAHKTDILQATLDTIPDGLLAVDPELKLIGNNERLFEILDLDREAILAAPDPALAIRTIRIERGDLGPGNRRAQMERLEAAIRDPAPRQYEQQLKSGRWIEVRSRAASRGGRVLVIRDITERVMAERNAAQQTELLRITFATIPDGLMVLDEDLRMVTYNDRLLEILDIDPALIRSAPEPGRALRLELARRGHFGTGDPETLVRSREAMLKSAPGLCYEKQMPSGRWIEYRSAPLPSGGRVALARDITAHKERETEREVAKEAAERARIAAEQASQAKSAFLANMSHEIRTPMNGVMGAAHLLLATTLNPEQHRYTDVIVKCGRHLLTVIDDILDISKMAAGRVKLETIEFALPDVVRTTLELLGPKAAEKRLRIETAIDPGAAVPVLGDPTRLRQVLVNLVGNAIKFTETGGVTVAARRLGGGEDRAVMQIEVADTGIGIADDARQRLFHNFTQADETISRRFGGTGLGLAISKQIVELMGGSIGVESELGAGSTFWITVEFPLAIGLTPSLPTEAMSEPTSPPRHRRVLLAEDVDINRLIAGEMLRKMGCDVAVAVDGVEARDAALAADFDLILMDIQMPRMDGVEATKRIRAAGGPRSRVPIVALTAHAIAGERDSYLMAGMDDYLTKPFEPHQLADLLDRWTENARVVAEDRVREPSPPSGILNERRLGELAAIMPSDRFAALIEAWVESVGELAVSVTVACDDVLAGEAHKLTGSAANFGAEALAMLAQRIETEARAGKADSARALVAEVDALYRDTVRAMRERSTPERKAVATAAAN